MNKQSRILKNLCLVWGAVGIFTGTIIAGSTSIGSLLLTAPLWFVLCFVSAYLDLKHFDQGETDEPTQV